MENLNLPPFYRGDKVVVISCANSVMIAPKLNNEVVTIKGPSTVKTGYFYIEEYPVSYRGNRQSFHYTDLRKVQESKFRAVSFEKIMEETEKICVN